MKTNDFVNEYDRPFIAYFRSIPTAIQEKSSMVYDHSVRGYVYPNTINGLITSRRNF